MSGPGPDLEPLTTLFERPSLPSIDGLPGRLRRLYGGGIGFRAPVLLANFVASVDGVTALGPDHLSVGSLISGHDPADRFVLALLRALADAILIGAETLRASPGHVWTAEHVQPWAARDVAALRAALGLAPRPTLVVITRRGALPADHPALAGPLVVATTPAAAGRLRRRLPSAEVLDPAAGDGVDLAALVAGLRRRGWSTLLCEGGPTLAGGLLRAGLLDELFLTVAPVLAGRRPGQHRPGIVGGAELLPLAGAAVELLSTRRHGSALFLRYAVLGSGAPVPAVDRGGTPP